MPVSLLPTSRRRFLAGSLATASSAFLGKLTGAFGQAGAESATWAFLSDTHIAADRSTVSRGINMTKNLEEAIRQVLGLAAGTKGVLVCGDCAHLTGQAPDYANLATLIQPLGKARLPVHLLMGNHDDRVTFAQVLATQAAQASSAVRSRYATVVEDPLANWYLLDSLDGTNKTPGTLGTDQLGWLEKELKARPNVPALVMVHHNIVEPKTLTSLQDGAELMAMLRAQRQVKAVFYGHSHRWELAVDQASGIHMVNLPPTAYNFKPEHPIGWVRAVVRKDGVDLSLHGIVPGLAPYNDLRVLKWRA